MLFLAAIFGYLCGSIPFAYIVSKFVAKIDIREHGSGNVGATNVMRKLGKKPAAFTLLGDIMKAFVPITILSFIYGADALIVLFFSMAVLIGHIYPVWLKFKGGKGVATGIAILLALDPHPALMVLAIWIVIFVIYRVASLASVVAAALSPICVYWFGNGYNAHHNLLVFSFLISAIIIAKHKQNIIRIIKKEEKGI